MDALLKKREILTAFKKGLEEGQEMALCSPLREEQVEVMTEKLLEVNNKGLPSEISLSKGDVHELKKLQRVMITVDEGKRETILASAAKSLFGLDVSGLSLSLSQKMLLVALMARKTHVDETVITGAIEKAKKKDRACTPGIPWARKDLLDLKGSDLIEMKIEDVLKVPGRWKDYIIASRNQTEARRVVIKGLQNKYQYPLRTKRRDRMLTAMSHEAEEHIWVIEVLITPRPEIDKIPLVKQLHESIIMHLFERLEASRVFLKNPLVGTAYMKAIRTDGPSNEKDYDKALKEAEKEVARRPLPTSTSYDFRSLVHQPRPAPPPPTTQRRQQPSAAPFQQPFAGGYRGSSAPPPPSRVQHTPPSNPHQRQPFREGTSRPPKYSVVKSAV